jgi:hypothetical protein
MDNQQGKTKSQKRTKDEDKIHENENDIFMQKMIALNKKFESFDASKVTQSEQTVMVISMFSFICEALPKVLNAMQTEKQFKHQVNTIQNVVIELNNEVSDLKKETLSLKKEILANNIQNSAKCLELKNEVSGIKKETLANNIQISAKCLELKNEVSSLKKETLTNQSKDSEQYLELRNEVTELKKETLGNEIESSAKSLELNNEVSELKRETLTNQIQASAKSLIVKDLAPLKATDKESEIDLRIQFEKVLSELQIKENVNVVTILRLKSNKMVPFRGKSTVLPIKVTFNSSFERDIFLSKLKYLKEFKTIKVSIDYPKFLQSSKNELEHIAYNIRKEMPGTKTSIRIKDQKLAIFARKNGETNFSEVEEY